MKFYQFNLKPESAEELVWAVLENAGVKVWYSSDRSLFGEAKEIRDFPGVESVTELPAPSIDWEEQWANQAGVDYKRYSEGKLHVDLSRLIDKPGLSPVVMRPGPGFGDLSHPTTRGMLNVMADVVQGKNVVDIGCGTGILTLASMSMGARSAEGVEIDPPSLKHARENGKENPWPVRFVSVEEWEKKPVDVVLINMISSEQAIAWPKDLKAAYAVSSGILESEEARYLSLKREWKVSQRHQIEEWITFLLYRTG